MLTYLFHTTICWGLFASVYALLLRRETFFRANRSYLLLTAALGIVLPLVGHQISALLPAPEALSVILPTLTVGLQQAEQAVGQWSVWPYLWWVYWAGAALAAGRMLWGVVAIFRIAANSRRARLPDGTVLLRTSTAVLPFSFFHWIFVPEHIEKDADFDNMLAHERAHARGWHSADVLLLEVLCAACWFHPLAHWYRRSLRTVHEFLADAEVSRRTGTRQYGLLLLRQVQPAHALVFANHFFQAPLKKRLLMLTRQASPAMQGWRYSVVLPVLVLLVFYFQKNNAPNKAKPVENQSILGSNLLTKQPEFPGGIPALIHYLSTHIRYPEAAKQQHLEGKVVVEFVLDQTGEVTQAKALWPDPKPAQPEYEALAAEAVRVVLQMPKWVPGQQDGHAVPCRMSLPVQFKLE